MVFLIHIICPVVLYGCETWPLTLMEESRLRVSDNRVLRRIFGPKRDYVTGEWRKLHNKELHDMYRSPNMVRVIKSTMRWAGHVSRMGKGRGVYRVSVVNRRERYHWGDLGVDGRIIFRWIFRKWEVGVWTGLSWPRIGTGGVGL